MVRAEHIGGMLDSSNLVKSYQTTLYDEIPDSPESELQKRNYMFGHQERTSFESFENLKQKLVDLNTISCDFKERKI